MTRLSENTRFIRSDCEIEGSTIGRLVDIGRGSRVAHSAIGDNSHCDRSCDIANSDVGNFSNIASYVRVGATDHPLKTASLPHFLCRSADYWDNTEAHSEWFETRLARRAAVGHDTWIGHSAQIKPEVTVGHGAVVASVAVVTKDVSPYTIVAGIPARAIRERQPNAIAGRLGGLAWWDWGHDRLRIALEDFRMLTAEAFPEKYE